MCSKTILAAVKESVCVCECAFTAGSSYKAQTSAKLPPTPYLFIASLALMNKQLCELPGGSKIDQSQVGGPLAPQGIRITLGVVDGVDFKVAPRPVIELQIHADATATVGPINFD